MKIFFSKYSLECNQIKGKTREGALLKFIFQDKLIGYADCHPWAELGDDSLQQQLEKLKKKQYTALIKQSLFFARLDASSREQNINLFHNLFIPPSNYLIKDLAFLKKETFQSILEGGFTHIKIKIKKIDRLEIENLKKLLKEFSHFILRIDCNEKLKYEEFLLLHDLLKNHHHQIEYYEDPIVYKSQDWRNLKNKNIPIACDFSAHLADSTCCSSLVLKPAIQECSNFFINKTLPITITSYLDHPIGQLSAAYTAAYFAKYFPEQVKVCGLLSHLSYKLNRYSEQLIMDKEGSFYPPEGTGFGFDKLLEEEKWILL